jgi:integrase
VGELKQRGKIWWIRYYRQGRRHEESARTKVYEEARDLLRKREGAIADGAPITAKIGRLRFEDAAKDVENDFTANGKRSLDDVKRRIRLHLTPFFGGRRMASITPADVRAYVAHRQKVEHEGDAKPANGQINRELAILKRMFTLAMQAGKLLHRPHIAMLRESNARAGFFEPEQYRDVLAHLPTAVQPVITFAYLTGWRVSSEILPLQWRQVNFETGEIRLDPGTTKNGEGRVFPLAGDLLALLEERRDQRDALKKAGHVTPYVFWRMVAKGRRGPKSPRKITAFTKAWRNACTAAGCPGRIPHDLRRTAVRTMVRRGIPERVCMMLTGHKTRSVFERYNIVSAGDLKTAAAQLTGLVPVPASHGQSAALPAKRRKFARVS